jgi:hypothetical protein
MYFREYYEEYIKRYVSQFVRVVSVKGSFQYQCYFTVNQIQ